MVPTTISSFGRVASILAACVAIAAVAGCATPPKDPTARIVFEQNNDPWEPLNRAIFDFNDAAYTNVLFPVARGYRALPTPARKGIHNVIGNINEPIVFMNKTLQGDVSSAGQTIGRFLINTIFGFGGLIDVASANKIPKAKGGDFGATLYAYGVGEGPYFVIPLLGPSNPRDTVGISVDGFAAPLSFFMTNPEQIGQFTVTGIDRLSGEMENYEEAKKTSLDFYAFLRSAYRQNRRFEVGDTSGGPGDDMYADPAAGGEDHP